MSFASVTLATSLLLGGLGSSLRAEKITYDQHVFPIFEQACLNCHNPDKTKGGLDLSSFPNTLKGGSGGKIVEPSDIGSKLIAVVRHSSEPIMPPEGEPLSGDQIKTLEAWIIGGLLENADSKAKKPSKPKFDTSLAGDPTARPSGPPPFPADLLLEPVVVAPRSSAVHAMVVSPWAPLLALTGQGQVLLYHSTHLDLVGILPFPEGEPTSLAFTPNGRYLIVGGGVAGKSGITITFDVITGERVLTAGKEFDSVLSADLSPDLSRVVTGSPSKRIKMWNSADGSQLASIKKHTDWVTSVDFSNDGILLATGDRNGGVWVWEGASGNEFHTLRGHQAGISEVRFRADSNVLASASEDGSVRFWEMNGGSEVKKIDAHSGGVLAFAWGQDGSFATAGRDRSAKLWKPDFTAHKTIPKLADTPTAIALDSQHKRVFVSDYQGHVAVYETEHGKQVGSIDANPPPIATRLVLLNQAKQDLTNDFDAATVAHNQQITAFRDAESRQADQFKRLEQARKDHQSSKQQLAKEQQLLQTINQKIDQLKTQKAEALNVVQQAQANRNALKQHIEDAKRELDRSTSELTQSQEARKTAEAETDPTKKAAAIQQTDDRVKQHTQNQAKARQQLDSLNQQTASLDSKLFQSQEHLQRLTEQQKQEQEALTKRQQSLPPLQKKIDQTGKQIADLEKQMPELQKQIDTAREARSKSGTRLWKARIAVHQNEHRIRRWTRADLLTQILQNREKMAMHQATSEQLAETFSETTKRVETLHSDLAEKRNELQSVQKRLSTSTDESQRTELVAIAATLQSIVADLNQQLTAISQELGKQREALDELLPSLDRQRRALISDEARYAASSGTSS